MIDAAGLSVIANTENKVLFPGGSRETIVKTNTPAEKILEFPSSYGSTFNQTLVNYTAYYFGSVPALPPTFSTEIRACGYSDSLRERIHINKTVLADAWGSITTLAGTFDAIRFKETRITSDTIDAHDAMLNAWFLYKIKYDSVITYSWYANNVGVPLATATMDSTGAVKNVTWLVAYLGSVGINDIPSSSSINVFPNPAQNQITFDVDATKVNSISIYDVTGRLIDSSPVSTNHVIINTSDYMDGIYVYSLFDKKSNTLNKGKFSVVK